MSISRFTFLMAAVLSIGAAAAPGADDLATTVAGKLRDSSTLKGYRVNVKAKSGTVWLEGKVSDANQIDAAVAAAQNTEGVERVVNRLTIGTDSAQPESSKGLMNGFALPTSIRSLTGNSAKASPKPVIVDPAASAAQTGQAEPETKIAETTTPAEVAPKSVQLAQAVAPAPRSSAPGKRAAPAAASQNPRPLGLTAARPLPPGRAPSRGPATGRHNMAMKASAMGQPMSMPLQGDMGGAGGYDDGGYAGNGYPANGQGLRDGQMVPGSMRMTEGGPAAGGMAGGPGMGGGPGMAGGPAMGGGPGMGPMPMRGAGTAGAPIPMRGDGPNVPNYAWPSYASHPNYAAVQYPTQYSPTAWPYIGPFYPYPQVPLGWRRVSLEWDDGWWFLDFDDRHVHSHHR